MSLLKESYCDQFKGDIKSYQVISKLDSSQDQDANLAIILSTRTKKEGLQNILNYLKINFSGKYPTATESLNPTKSNINKTDLALQLLNFVFYTYPHLCLKCNTDYLPLSADNSANSEVECFTCKLPAHATCFKKENIDKDKGIILLCQTCLQQSGKNLADVPKKKTKVPLAEEKEEEKEEEDGDKHESSTSSEDTDDSDTDSWSVKKKKERKKKITKQTPKEQDCPLLLEGKCPHGLSGKKCEYKHRKQCNRYRSFGTKQMHGAGCKFGEKCRYLHPNLCQNSVQMKMCLNESCTFVHLKYTKRSQPTGENKQINDYRKPNFQQQSKYANRGANTSRSQTPNFSPNENTLSYSVDQRYEEPQNQSFLEKAMDKMRKDFSRLIQQQIQMQFQQMQNGNYYETEYPSLQTPQQW